MTQTIEPIISYLSGFFLSTKNPHMIDEMIKIPPYAASILTQFEKIHKRPGIILDLEVHLSPSSNVISSNLPQSVKMSFSTPSTLFPVIAPSAIFSLVIALSATFGFATAPS
jgi:hypothetical protein